MWRPRRVEVEVVRSVSLFLARFMRECVRREHSERNYASSRTVGRWGMSCLSW
jgi:hypothetical protein